MVRYAFFYKMRAKEFASVGLVSRSTDPVPSTITGCLLASLAIAVFASIAVSPFIFQGNPAGHDVIFHLTSWMEVARQWHEGVIYPRWAAGANYGLGEPRFVFYPPMSWILGAALSLVLPWRMVPGALAWLALVVAGAAMFRLAREYMPPRDASLAAVVYAANPYHLLVVYQRCAFSELLASAAFPLVILYGLRIGQQAWKSVVSLALVFAVVWLTNPPAAVIVTYSLLVVFVVVALIRKSFSTITFGTTAMTLGFLLAAFYIIPATFEQRWVSLAFPLRLQPDRNFLFGATEYEGFIRFNLLVSTVALAEIAATACAVVLCRKQRSNWPEMWWALVVLGVISVTLMAPVSSIAWHYLPKLWFVQFPWRWLFVLNVGLAIFVAAATARFPVGFVRWLLISAILVILLKGIIERSNFPAPVAQLESAVSQGRGYQGRVEYLAPGSTSSLPVLSLPEVAIADTDGSTAPGRTGKAPDTLLDNTSIHIERWGPESRDFSVDFSRPTRLALRLRNYPAWRAAVNGSVVQTQSSEDSGQMIIQVPAGHSNVRLRFARTPDRVLGGVLSAAAAVLTLGLHLWQRRKDANSPCMDLAEEPGGPRVL
jgi:hypothetical protein